MQSRYGCPLQQKGLKKGKKMVTTFSQAWAKAQLCDYSGLFASEDLYGRQYSGKQSGYSTPHRKLTPHLMSFSEVDACSSTLAVRPVQTI
jgi:hypothetical protein